MYRPLILIVDDDRGLLEALESELQARFGHFFQVESYESPADVLERMPFWRDEGRPIGLLIVDQKMPQMTGVELVAAVRGSVAGNASASPAAHARAILITGYAGLESAVASKNVAGVDRYVEKPWDSGELAAQVEDLLLSYLDDSGYGIFYEFREVSGGDEILTAATLRHEVARHLPATGSESAADALFDEYDVISRHFLLSRVGPSQAVPVGSLRVVEQRETPEGAVLRGLAAANHEFARELNAPRRVPLPSLRSSASASAIQDLYWRLRRSGEHVFDIGPVALVARARRRFAEEFHLTHHLLASVLARYFVIDTVENGLMTCDAARARSCARFGLRVAEGTASAPPVPSPNNEVCLHGRRSWAEPGAEAVLQSLGQRLTRTHSTCFCHVQPACLTRGYETGEFHGDLFCPLAALQLLRARALPASEGH